MGTDEQNATGWQDIDSRPGYDDSSPEELKQALVDASKLWLAHDGLWFLEWEKRHGMEEAIEADAAAWGRFARTEARRIMARLGIEPGGGIDALAQCLRHRLWANMCAISLKRRHDNELRLRMKDCRVHNARDRKGLPRFPCKSVGLMEFPAFAETVDPRIETTCVQCPPDELTPGGYCEWHYVLKDAK